VSGASFSVSGKRIALNEIPNLLQESLLLQRAGVGKS
jgi:hypothetical protein